MKTLKLSKNFLILTTWFFIPILFSMSSIMSAPPVTQVQQFTEGYIIEGNPQEIIEFNQTYQFNFFVYNISNGNLITNTSATCVFYMADNYGEVIIYKNVPYSSMGYWGLVIDKGNFSYVGHYNYGTKCNSSNYGGAMIGYFEATKRGEYPDTSVSIFYVGFLMMLIIFFILTAISFVYFENMINRFGMLGLGYLLLTVISFISWQMADAFIINSPFLVTFLRLVFFILMFSALPLFLGFFAWYLLALMKIKEIQDLMNKGIPESEAEWRAGGMKRR